MSGSPPPEPVAAVAPASPTAEVVAAAPPPSAVQDLERRQREAAAFAAAQGRWSEAAWAWDVVLALQPGDTDAQRSKAQAEASAVVAAAELLPRARQAREKGDLEGAARLYLEVLILTPANKQAADALRSIEAERSKRTPRSFARSMGLVGGPSTPTVGRRKSSNPRAYAGEMEHASMLAAQGEVSAAIQVIKSMENTPRWSAAARAKLADLYLRQADMLVPTNRTAAIEALENRLRHKPSDLRAKLRLRELQQVGR